MRSSQLLQFRAEPDPRIRAILVHSPLAALVILPTLIDLGRPGVKLGEGIIRTPG